MKKEIFQNIGIVAGLAGFLSFGNLIARDIHDAYRWEHQRLIWKAIDLAGSEERVKRDLGIPFNKKLRAEYNVILGPGALGGLHVYSPDKEELKQLIKSYEKNESPNI